MNAILAALPTMSVAMACAALTYPRSTFYRRRRPPSEPVARRSSPPRSLCSEERAAVLQVLQEDRFMDKAPAEVYATLLDEGNYHCSVRTMYRILAAAGQLRERRDQLRHPHYSKPELLATGPNQVWSWDITKLLGPAKWTYFYTYVLLDIFSRYVVGWLIADGESSTLAQHLIGDSCRKQGIQPGQLTVHADRGTAMTSKSVALLMADLGITKTHSRPQVSDDNPYSESQFKTLKYRPDFPERFGSIEDAKSHCKAFFAWYNDEHHHSSLGLLTPAMVHHGRTDEVLAARGAVLTRAYAAHPERFVARPPRPAAPPAAAWINPPARLSQQTAAAIGPEPLSTGGAAEEGDQRHPAGVAPRRSPRSDLDATSPVGNGAPEPAPAPRSAGAQEAPSARAAMPPPALRARARPSRNRRPVTPHPGAQ